MYKSFWFYIVVRRPTQYIESFLLEMFIFQNIYILDTTRGHFDSPFCRTGVFCDRDRPLARTRTLYNTDTDDRRNNYVTRRFRAKETPSRDDGENAVRERKVRPTKIDETASPAAGQRRGVFRLRVLITRNRRES